MAKKYPKNYAPNPNEWVPHLPKMQWQCCDCGLVHNVEFKMRTFDVKMTRNMKETKKVRQYKTSNVVNLYENPAEFDLI